MKSLNEHINEGKLPKSKELKQLTENFFNSEVDFFSKNKNIEIVDYSNSKNKILVGLKSNLLNDMKDRYPHRITNDQIYFFDRETKTHFGTLFDVGTRYQMLLHNGQLDDYGWVK